MHGTVTGKASEPAVTGLFVLLPFRIEILVRLKGEARPVELIWSRLSAELFVFPLIFEGLPAGVDP